MLVAVRRAIRVAVAGAEYRRATNHFVGCFGGVHRDDGVEQKAIHIQHIRDVQI